MVDDRPAWARRMTNERKARGWSQADAVRAMRAHAPGELPSDPSLLRQWKRWEAGEVDAEASFYKPIIAATFGTVTHAMFPVAPQRDAEADVLAMAGMDTLELVSRLQRSDLDQATLDGLRIMADRLCSEYPYMPADQLLTEGRAWLRRITALQGQRVTLKQHREILVQAGWVALLVGLRGVRHRQPASRGNHPPGRVVARHRSRPRRDHRLGARDARLDQPDHRRLPRRGRGGPGRDGGDTAKQCGGAARRPGSQGVGSHR